MTSPDFCSHCGVQGGLHVCSLCGNDVMRSLDQHEKHVSSKHNKNKGAANSGEIHFGELAPRDRTQFAFAASTDGSAEPDLRGRSST